MTFVVFCRVDCEDALTRTPLSQSAQVGRLVGGTQMAQDCHLSAVCGCPTLSGTVRFVESEASQHSSTHSTAR